MLPLLMFLLITMSIFYSGPLIFAVGLLASSIMLKKDRYDEERYILAYILYLSKISLIVCMFLIILNAFTSLNEHIIAGNLGIISISVITLNAWFVFMMTHPIFAFINKDINLIRPLRREVINFLENHEYSVPASLNKSNAKD